MATKPKARPEPARARSTKAKPRGSTTARTKARAKAPAKTSRPSRKVSVPPKAKVRRSPTRAAGRPKAKAPSTKPASRPRAKAPSTKPVTRTSAHAARPGPAASSPTIRLRVNRSWHELIVGRDLEPSTTLASLLKERLGLTGLKIACDEGACGACTVMMDGRAVLSCMTLAIEADGHEIVTIEGLPEDDPVVQAFVEQCEPGYGTALQCGYCTPGFIITARALLNENPRPTLPEVKEALSGNLCRCGCYAAIAQAVLHAADRIAAQGGAR